MSFKSDKQRKAVYAKLAAQLWKSFKPGAMYKVLLDPVAGKATSRVISRYDVPEHDAMLWDSTDRFAQSKRVIAGIGSRSGLDTSGNYVSQYSSRKGIGRWGTTGIRKRELAAITALNSLLAAKRRRSKK